MNRMNRPAHARLSASPSDGFPIEVARAIFPCSISVLAFQPGSTTTKPSRSGPLLCAPSASWTSTASAALISIGFGGVGSSGVMRSVMPCCLFRVGHPVHVLRQHFSAIEIGFVADHHCVSFGLDPSYEERPIGGDAALAYLARETAAIRATGARIIEIIADEPSALAMGPVVKVALAVDIGLRSCYA